MTKSLDQALFLGADVSAFAMMNMAVNSFCNVSNESGDAAQTVPANSGKYIVDQMVATNQGSTVLSGQRVANPFPSMPAIQYGVKLTVTTASGAQSATDLVQIHQPIEGLRMSRLSWGTGLAIPMTTGRVIRPSLDLVAYVGVQNFNGSRSNMKRVFLPANQDTFIPIQFEPDTTGTYLKDISPSFYDLIILSAGSTYKGVVGNWQSTNIKAGADVSNFAAAVGNSVIVSGPVLLPGVVPLNKDLFQLLGRHQLDEERLCRRYWRRNPVLSGNAGSATVAQLLGTLDEPMRTTPTAGAFNIANCLLSPYVAFYNLASITAVAMTNGGLGLQLDVTTSGPSMSPNIPVFMVPDKLYLNARM
jgi:hypothetical protein